MPLAMTIMGVRRPYGRAVNGERPEGRAGPPLGSEFVDERARYGVDDPLDEHRGQLGIIPLVDGDIALLAILQDMLIVIAACRSTVGGLECRKKSAVVVRGVRLHGSLLYVEKT